MSGWQRVHLDELPDLAVGVGGGRFLRWRPVRMTLDARAFGTNAYTAPEAGADVVEPHTEEGSDHEELYFVHRGRARFTLGDETFEAPEGTYVHISDPSVHRHAVALEAGTTILSFGGPSTFEPSEWEWRFKASAQRKEGDDDGARATLAEARDRFPGSGEVVYEQACMACVAGDHDGAWELLQEALRLTPRTAAWARDDDELAAIASRLPPEERS